MFADAGGLMSYGPDIRDIYHRCAIYVDKILKGAKPADFLVEQPKKFDPIINLKTVKQLGLTRRVGKNRPGDQVNPILDFRLPIFD
jgi:putative tryptophan/tyrosine transport system substrate-binding protein